MNLRILKLGKPAFSQYSGLVQTYSQRITRVQKLRMDELKCSGETLSTKERKALNTAIQSADLSVFLDEKGKGVSSQSIAQSIDLWRSDSRIKEVILVVGGPFGLPSELKSEFDDVWCLSSCTLTSDMAWLVLTEQIYRGLKINEGSSYHHE